MPPVNVGTRMELPALLRPDSGRGFAFTLGAVGAVAGVLLSTATGADDPLLWASAGAVVGIVAGMLVESMR